MKSISRKTKRRLNRLRCLVVRIITFISSIVFFLGLSVDWEYTPFELFPVWLGIMIVCLLWLFLFVKENGW